MPLACLLLLLAGGRVLAQWAQLQKLQPASGRAFGAALALEGSTMVVGSNREDGNAGAAYVYERQGNGTWLRVARLTASDRSNGDDFGVAVALSGNTIVVGAPDRRGAGGVYVFEKPASGWADGTQNAKLTAPRPDFQDQFGHAVAVSGHTVAAGDPFHGDQHGGVFVLEKPAGGWANATMTRISAPPTDERLKIGSSVALTGNRLVAGAIGAGGNRGRVLVYEKPAGGWVGPPFGTPSTALVLPNGAANDFFGWAVAASGSTLVASAVGFARNQGAGFVFEKTAGGWAGPVARLMDQGSAADRFGVSLGLNGDRVVAGAFLHNANRGAAYVFEKPGSGWTNATESAKLSASDGVANDLFGGAVGVWGASLVVGAPRVGTDQGAAYVFGPDNSPTLNYASPGSGLNRREEHPPELLVLANPVSGGIIRCRVTGMANPEFSLVTSAGRTVGLLANTDGSGEWVLTPRQPRVLGAGVYVLQASEGQTSLTTRVLLAE